MVMSLSCIVLGIGLFIVTQATTSGFEGFFIKTILGTNGAILIQDKLQATMRSLDAGSYHSGYEILPTSACYARILGPANSC